MTWENCCDLLDINKINYFISKSREHLVVKNFIEKFDKPFVRLKGFHLKVEVVKEKISEFVLWLNRDDN
jgi:hypothetical protein